MNQEIREKLESLREKEYAEFSCKIIPGAGKVLGIRMPVLRKLAKELALEQGESVLTDEEDIYYEEVMIRGLVIGYLKTDSSTLVRYVTDFIPRIHNWAVCDAFCSNLKRVKKDKERFWELIGPYARSEQEFEQRFAAVMLLAHFVNAEDIEKTLHLLTVIPTEHYYSSMGVAWAVAECFLKFPEETEVYFVRENWDSATRKRILRKICDSYRVSQEVKERLKEKFRLL